MICQRYGRTPGRKTLAAYVVAGVSVSAVFIGALAPFPASADGKDPRPTKTEGPDVLSANSENSLYGRQNTSTTTTAGATSVQNALCRNARICNITQKVIVVSPEQAVEVTPAPTPTPTPAVTPEVVVDPAPVAVPVVTPEPVRPALLSLGLLLFLHGA
ncbi:hypothetical protein Psi02_07890 [Planotetraspora silvatica]|uniref:Uncharacterized protein n=1 Tax=Planotetraspora silvatica TaxID=234614 RepID=A0A8J3UGR4_9ACTN|nr:hypothetical protein [Planotetraspora silvatica]GII44365.1 hypothetical protein Psi02_07890 [Planotetraspora silvatica]